MQHSVDTNVQPEEGSITLRGLRNHVLDAYADIAEFLQDNLVASMVQWCFIDVSINNKEENFWGVPLCLGWKCFM